MTFKKALPQEDLEKVVEEQGKIIQGYKILLKKYRDLVGGATWKMEEALQNKEDIKKQDRHANPNFVHPRGMLGKTHTKATRQKMSGKRGPNKRTRR